MKVLLTGIGGAIGAHVYAHIMANTDWEVVGIDSFHHKGYYDRITKLHQVNFEWKDRLKVIQHDLTCPISQEMKDEIGEVDFILHLAAMSDVGFSIENPYYVIKNNVESTLNMLEYARYTPHEAFVYFSTDEVYGPTTVDQGHNEWDTHRPSNAYAASKAMSEDACYSYWRNGYIRYINTNTMNNFAEMQSPSKFPAMIQKQIEAGEEITVHGTKDEIGTRYYIHSRTAADALLFILQNLPPHPHFVGEIDEPDRYHIVGNIQLNNLELVEKISDLMAKPAKVKLVDFHHSNPAHDIHYGLVDNKLAAAGWKPQMGFEESLARTIEWQRANPEWINDEQ